MAREPVAKDVWTTGAAYEAYVGRWSRLVAAEFVRWLGVPPRSRWLDVGCGSGALAEAILERAAPHLVLGVDRSKGFVAHTSARLAGTRLALHVADAQALPVQDGGFDAVVSGLVLNFVSEPARMVAEMARAGRPGSSVPRLRRLLGGARIQGDETGGSRSSRPGGMSGRRDAVDTR